MFQAQKICGRCHLSFSQTLVQNVNGLLLDLALQLSQIVAIRQKFNGLVAQIDGRLPAALAFVAVFACFGSARHKKRKIIQDNLLLTRTRSNSLIHINFMRKAFNKTVNEPQPWLL